MTERQYLDYIQDIIETDEIPPLGRSSPRFSGHSNKEVGLVRGSVQAPAGFLLRIELMEILPPIWRRFKVPGAITLHGLHRVIQEVMGWENYHLHLFRFGEKEYGIPDPDCPTEMVEWRGPSFNPERFDPARINRWLHPLSWSRRRR